ncbi:Helix-loop-helix DNA-binding domain [Musa troglodytarum]|uniref:Helix-loop-helix DNA-binding domain n=1 Tax=Musa troglodytarum TaxID=320322 RepID=A0A9E7KIU9_9LILI|nr:Helix-loop-helix DNA-binding domain [Musa troglodytarum]
MFPTMPAGREGRSDLQAEMLSGLPAYFMASFYPHMEMEMETETAMSGEAVDATPTDRALVASRNHREAERRRRERIKSHLDRLRTILACDPKTDKASLLAKVVERMKDLKQRVEEITDAQCFPSETDEIVVLPSSASISGQRSVFEASFCCEDRSDLLPELIDTLRSLRLKTLRAEIATLGGRVRNVLILAKENEASEEEEEEEDEPGGVLLRDALKALVDRPHPAERCKRRRLVDQDST